LSHGSYGFPRVAGIILSRCRRQVCFEIVHPVLEINDPLEELLVHPVLPLHQGADKIADRVPGLYVRVLRIFLAQLVPGILPDRAPGCPGLADAQITEPGPALREPRTVLWLF